MLDNAAQCNKRFPGVDVAKIIAIYFVIVVHLLGNGFAFRDGSTRVPCQAILYHTLLGLSFSCIDLFALATGYLCIHSNCRYSRIVNLWLAAVFWGVVMLLACSLCGYSVAGESYLDAVLPIWHDQYWFLSAYFMMFLIMPLMNKAILAMTRKEFRQLFAAVAIFVCGYSMLGADVFGLRSGYSFPWLCMVYVIGAYIRLFNPCRWRKLCCFMSAVGIAIATAFAYLSLRHFLPNVRFSFVSYVSAPTLSIAILIFMGSLQIEFGERMSRIVKAVAATTFGIYLIHVQPFVWRNIWKVGLSRIKIGTAFELILAVAGLSIAVFAVLALLEHLRQVTFERIGLNRVVAKIDTWVSR